MRRITLLTLMFGLLVSSSLDAREIRGIVRSGCHRLPEVLVTDGKSFVRTDSRGRYRMDVAEDARFVSVVTPDGYIGDYSNGVPQFYQRITDAEVYKFNLKQFSCQTPSGPKFNIVAVADPQTQTEENFQEFCGKPLDALIEHSRALSQKNTTIGITLGDICWDEVSFLPRYREEMKKTGIPFYAVIGNHDFNENLSGMAAAADYEAYYGPVNWAAWMGGTFMIALNNIMYKTGRGYDVGYDEETLAWLEKLLAYVPESVPLLIFQHSPLDLWRDKKWAINSDRILAMLGDRKVDFITGHRHYHNQLSYGEKIKDHNITSYCGLFWKGNRSADGTPRGFEVFTADNGKLSWYYQPVGYSSDYQMDVCAPGEAVVNKDCVVVNVWDADDNWVIDWYQDGKYMGPMEPTMDATPMTYESVMEGFGVDSIDKVHWAYRPAPLMHFYKARPAEGAKVIRIQVKNPFGKEWNHEVKL